MSSTRSVLVWWARKRTPAHEINHSVNEYLNGNPIPRTTPFCVEAKLASTRIENSVAQSGSQCQRFSLVFFGFLWFSLDMSRRKCLTDSEIQTTKEALSSACRSAACLVVKLLCSSRLRCCILAPRRPALRDRPFPSGRLFFVTVRLLDRAVTRRGGTSGASMLSP
jgi:hypothetical protein